MPYSTLRLCSGGGGYEAIPAPRHPLDLAQVRNLFEARSISLIDARVMLIVDMEREVTISRDGRILIKTQDVAQAERIFRLLREWLQLSVADLT
jgi:hypothetical protein